MNITKEDLFTFHKLDDVIYWGILEVFMQRIMHYNGCKNMAEFGICTARGSNKFLNINPYCHYVGYDDWTGADAAGEAIARKALKHYPNVTIFKQNTHTVKELPVKMDFVYVDGGHSTPDCLNDLELAKNNITEKGVIIVHDYFFHPVFKATEEWYQKNKEEFNRRQVNLHRGWMIFWRKQK